MTSDAAHLISLLARDPLRHITPLKMYRLYRDAMRVVPILPVAAAANAALLIAPRAVSQYDQTHYADVTWVVMPALPADAGDAVIAAAADTLLAAVDDAPFVLKTIEPRLVAALQARRAGCAAPQYRRALCTFGVGAAHERAVIDRRVHIASHIPLPARALLREHAVYSDTELDALFADGSARCHLCSDGTGRDRRALGVLLTFPNTPSIHEIGSLHVLADARRAGHASTLLASALADLQRRALTVRYVVDATNVPSVALATRVGFVEQLRLAHWVFA